jgi:hypothetical protein
MLGDVDAREFRALMEDIAPCAAALGATPGCLRCPRNRPETFLFRLLTSVGTERNRPGRLAYRARTRPQWVPARLDIVGVL